MLSSRTDVNRNLSIEVLWHSAPVTGHPFDPERYDSGTDSRRSLSCALSRNQCERAFPMADLISSDVECESPFVSVRYEYFGHRDGVPPARPCNGCINA
jgi:hypothetical protein